MEGVKKSTLTYTRIKSLINLHINNGNRANGNLLRIPKNEIGLINFISIRVG